MQSRNIARHPILRLVVLLIGCLGMATSTIAETIAGRADVIDADTLDIHGERIRLLDVDAPEADQTCQRSNGKAWPCGQQAMSKLAGWIGHRILTCQTERKDRYGRWLAYCEAGGEDVGQWLASRGWAVPYLNCKCENIRAASEYAREDGSGLWSGTFVMPWEWRKNP